MLSTLSIGMMMGGIARSVSVIADVLHFPMLIFSKTALPFKVMTEIMQKVIIIFPLSQGIYPMNAAFLSLVVEPFCLLIIIMLCVALTGSGITIKCSKWE